MTPQVLHAMLASGWLTVGSERLNVSPKTTEQIIFWLQQEEGLTECTFEQLDLATQYSLLSHNQYCIEMGMPQRNLCDYRFFHLPRGEKTEFLYTAFERTGFAYYQPVTLYVYWDTAAQEARQLSSNSPFLTQRLTILRGISREQAISVGKEDFLLDLKFYCEHWQRELEDRKRDTCKKDTQKQKKIHVSDIKPFVPPQNPRTVHIVKLGTVRVDETKFLRYTLENEG